MPIQSTLFVWLFASLCIPLLSQSCDPLCKECLTQSDFDYGTYRITTSGKYCLSENIQFAPFNSENPNFDWFPHSAESFPGCTEFKNGAFALGYFAAITIETDDVELDLNGFSMSQTFNFYIQQRFFSIIEIGKSPFMEGFGPTNFGPLDTVTNIYIHSGILGLSSHHGIHSNEANNVQIEDLEIYDFEVGGIQMNGFTDLILRNINIGPSSHKVYTSGYYSNGRFLSLALNKLLTQNPQLKNQIITFSGNRILTLEEIFNNLMLSMNMAFRHFTNQTTQTDIDNELYQSAIDLFGNPSLLPDGSSLYGLLLHSRNLAIFGFGNFENEPIGDGENVLIENVNINNLEININEIPIMYFDKCMNSDTITVLKGPFGDVLDIRKMVDNGMNIFDNGMYLNNKELKYIGNVLSDAQIGLAMYGKEYGLSYGSNGMDSIEQSLFLQWALDGSNYNLKTECISFICNNDIMQHTNKGIIGARFDLIEDIIINKLQITHIYNQSPLSSYACKNYTGEYDGGSHGQLNDEGSTGTHSTGMTVYGGNIVFKGINTIDKIKSEYGSAYGLHAMYNAMITMYENSESELIISNNIKSGSLINYKGLMYLINTNQFPFPNNFEQCNIKINKNDNVKLIPNPPNGIHKIMCKDNNVIERYKNGIKSSNSEGIEFMDNNNNNETADLQLSIPLWINIYVLSIMFVIVHAILGYYYFTMPKDDEKKKETQGAEQITIVDSLP